MKINIVTEPEPGWVLRKWSLDFQKGLSDRGHEVIVGNDGISNTDVNLYVNYALFKRRHPGVKEVCVFTHKEKNPELGKIFDSAAMESDLNIAMCWKTYYQLPDEKNNAVILIPPHNQFFLQKPIKIGVVGRTYGTGRKNEDWVGALKCLEYIDIISTYDNPVPFEKMPEFYDNIDYLLIIADNEGGPMPVLEALARHKPVIAPDVGLSWDFPVIHYNGFDDLIAKLRKLSVKNYLWSRLFDDLDDLLLTVVSN